MASQLSSRERLATSTSIRQFEEIFAFHGALGHRHVIGPTKWTEAERLAIVPLTFGLMPKAALQRSNPHDRIKPAITAHLTNLKIEPYPLLVDIIKSISDQYYRTSRFASNRSRKYGIADLRAGRVQYRRLRQEQNDRCALCGVLFGGDYEETLDHVIPWRLIGDVPDGANYQLLCSLCNRGKHAYLSSLQSTQALNWIYGSEQEGTGISYDTRFIALANSNGCTKSDCTHTAMDVRLLVCQDVESGLGILDHVRVLCEKHAQPQSATASE